MWCVCVCVCVCILTYVLVPHEYKYVVFKTFAVGILLTLDKLVEWIIGTLMLIHIGHSVLSPLPSKKKI